ncbi:MBL fold metallo-hydrolase [Actinoplanes sp. KI2]|uniref:MBL fold metallo-hydrolase n=1 Tax=Actinoplanes sp. KI2 TaxID=2983315 RepID=UPI0021D573E3|nr:MBL fold metallo-hydrolase [Actinoplanes sp. KI2]MCU7724448.1 MBL fold metallo-hydrolase [Actinoplanes sp. KI2]
MMLGQTLVEFVPDGQVVGRGTDFFPGSDWTPYQDLLDDEGRMVANVGSFLIRTAGHVVLVDLGLGPGGALLDNLEALGVAPSNVDFVVLTHLHRDHVGWTGAFPRAQHLVDRREWDYWCAHPGGVGPDPDRVLTPMARRVASLEEVPRGIRPIATPGHTPGHTSLLISDPDTADRILILGDLLHTRAQFAEPTWRFRSDADPGQAIRRRVDLLARYRDGRTILAGGHFSGDAFGESENENESESKNESESESEKNPVSETTCQPSITGQ